MSVYQLLLLFQQKLTWDKSENCFTHDIFFAQNGSKQWYIKESHSVAESAGLWECQEDVLTVFLTSLSLDREEMKSLQAALQKQLDEANERAEKQQATVRQSWPDHQHPVFSNHLRHLSHRSLSDPRLLASSQLSQLLASPLNWNSQK